MFKRVDPFGHANVGVYVRATDKHVFVAPGLTKRNRKDIEDALDVEAVQLTLGGSTLIGSLMAANTRGAVLADIATDAEAAVVSGCGLNVLRLQNTRLNAAGNNLLVNDLGGLAHPRLSKKVVAAASEALGVEFAVAPIANVPTTGTAACATSRGVLTHPLASDDELSFIAKSLHRPARIGTVNHGHGLVGAGLAANRNGAVVGSRTTGIELGRIEEALGFLE